MKIHFFVLTLNETRGGSHHNAIAFIRALRELGNDITVHAFSSYDNQPPSDIPLTVHEGGGYGVVEGKRYLVRLLEECQSTADVFFLYGTDFAWGAGAYRTSGAVPVVVYLDTYLSSMGIMHDDAMSRFGYLRYVIKRLIWDKLRGLRLARHVDRYLAVSPYIRDTYVRFGFPSEKFAVIPNFFDPLPESPAKVPGDTVNLLYTGRFTYDKGTDLLLRALSKVRSHRWRLRMVGDGPQNELCRELISRYRLEGLVEIIPWSEALALEREYAAADVFVHPARWPEPFGRTIVEALGHGLPVIVPRKGAASWIADDAGLTFKNGDERELRAAIERLIDDAGLRTDLGRTGRARSLVFSRERVVPELEKVLETVYNAGYNNGSRV